MRILRVLQVHRRFIACMCGDRRKLYQRNAQELAEWRDTRARYADRASKRRHKHRDYNQVLDLDLTHVCTQNLSPKLRAR